MSIEDMNVRLLLTQLPDDYSEMLVVLYEAIRRVVEASDAVLVDFHFDVQDHQQDTWTLA